VLATGTDVASGTYGGEEVEHVWGKEDQDGKRIQRGNQYPQVHAYSTASKDNGERV